MDNRMPPPKTPFDTLISSTHLDMMKLILPMMPASYQSMFAIFIKFQEIQETIRVFRQFPNGLKFSDITNDASDNPNMIDLMKPYLPKENLEMFDTISNMMNIMEMMKAMSDINGEDNSMDFLKNMLSPEQQSMFDAMNQMYDNPETSKGDNNE